MQTFIQFSIVFSLYIALYNRRSMSPNFLIFNTLGGILSRHAVFLSFLLFLYIYIFCPVSSSSSVNCPSLMPCWLLINFW